jgi:hypothetical protein
MKVHKAKAIIDGFINALQSVNITTFQSRTLSIDAAETPSVIVSMGSEERTYEMPFVRCLLNVDLTLNVTATPNNIDNDLLLLRGQVENQLQLSNDFGIDYVIDVYLGDVTDPEVNTAADVPTAKLNMSYVVDYRYDPNNPLI